MKNLQPPFLTAAPCSPVPRVVRGPDTMVPSGAKYDGAKRRKGSKTHLAVDTLGHLLALHVTAANEQDRAQVEIWPSRCKR